MGLSASESGHSSILSSEENNGPDRKFQAVKMAYSWDNRVKFVVRFMYDIDNNGFLDKNDFECLAVRNTIIESKGKWDDAKFAKQGGHGQPLERDRRARRLQQGRRGLSRGV